MSPLVLVAAVLAAAVATVAPPAIPAARAAGGVKVAIIVGATHSVTPRYRSNADEVYAEALKYTSNVVRVYSPHATAAKVKAAVSGASVVVYLGHGNGWPSPYTFDPNYTTKDGFGLNADLNGDGKLTDSENKYYGEPWIRDLHPAPNAVVLLFHLCYASGNSEPGKADPSLSTAKQRVDNYGAAFLRAGFRAVVAIGHSHDDYYMGALFNTRQTIDDYFRNAPDANDNVSQYSSSRTPGYQFLMDPDGPGDYYRSVVGKLSLRTVDVTGAPYADTSADPPSIQVPGNASPVADGTPVYGSLADAAAGANPVATLGPDARIRVDAKESAVSVVDGSPVYRIHTEAVTGWMTGASLFPRDGAAPQVWEVDDGTGRFSPNADTVQDALPLSIRLSEPSAWTLRIRDGDWHTVATFDGEGDEVQATWAPAKGSVADGEYRWFLEASDAWDNGPLRADGTLVVDTKAPELSVADADGAIPQFSPNGDGVGDSIKFAVVSSEPGSVRATVLDAGDDVVDQASAGVSGAGTLAWDGKVDGGSWAGDGSYSLSIQAVDRAGNSSAPQLREVNAYGALGYMGASRPVFFPQDGDGLAASTSLTFRLRSPATVDWTIRNAAGQVVRTIRSAEALAAGTQSFTWNGRNDAGAFVPRGTYRSAVTATDGPFSTTQTLAVVADAFKVTASDTTPARGQTITVTAVSAETLDAAPRLRITQPGRAAWTVRMSRVEGRTWRVKVTLRSGGTGTLQLRVSAPDSNGARQRSFLALPLH
jgi:flagellar hook assembly protein FlgD